MSEYRLLKVTDDCKVEGCPTVCIGGEGEVWMGSPPERYARNCIGCVHSRSWKTGDEQFMGEIGKVTVRQWRNTPFKGCSTKCCHPKVLEENTFENCTSVVEKEKPTCDKCGKKYDTPGVVHMGKNSKKGSYCSIPCAMSSVPDNLEEGGPHTITVREGHGETPTFLYPNCDRCEEMTEEHGCMIHQTLAKCDGEKYFNPKADVPTMPKDQENRELYDNLIKAINKVFHVEE